eukprot:354365-Chlamydomonas_euryale.AAC.3
MSAPSRIANTWSTRSSPPARQTACRAVCAQKAGNGGGGFWVRAQVAVVVVWLEGRLGACAQGVGDLRVCRRVVVEGLHAAGRGFLCGCAKCARARRGESIASLIEVVSRGEKRCGEGRNEARFDLIRPRGM